MIAIQILCLEWGAIIADAAWIAFSTHTADSEAEKPYAIDSTGTGAETPEPLLAGSPILPKNQPRRATTYPAGTFRGTLRRI
jgi:hypothetical protein